MLLGLVVAHVWPLVTLLTAVMIVVTHIVVTITATNLIPVVCLIALQSRCAYKIPGLGR